MSCNVVSASFTLSTLAPSTSPSTAAEAVAAGEIIRALEIDPTTGDLVHDGKRIQFVSGVEAIAQSLRTRLGFFMEEWFLDEEFGVPWFQRVLGKASTLLAVKEIFRAIILGTTGVDRILTLELTQASTPRDFVLSFRVDTDLGELALTVNTGV